MHVAYCTVLPNSVAPQRLRRVAMCSFAATAVKHCIRSMYENCWFDKHSSQHASEITAIIRSLVLANFGWGKFCHGAHLA